MGLDGFSMGNLGLNADMTSAQMASQSERIALKESEIKIKDVAESDEKSGVKRKKDEEFDPKNQFNDGFKEKKKDHDENQSQSDLIEKEFETKDPKEFSVRINHQTDMIELFNNKEEKVLEAINPHDLMKIMSKLDYASGILVNRKI